MITLQYLSRGKWIDVGVFGNERMAWISLGGDDLNYRTVDKELTKVLTDKS
jgi:hypothetical protein